MMRNPISTLLMAGVLISGGCLVSKETQEYQAKVVLMEKITAYVDWPAPPASDHPFVLGVVGRTPFGDELDTYFLAHSLKGRSVRIRYFSGAENIEPCDLLFICASEKDRLAVVLAKVKGRPILTIGDTPGFAKAGVMMNLVREGTRLAFEVNIASTKASGLRMAASLLNLSKIVDRVE